MAGRVPRWPSRAAAEYFSPMTHSRRRFIRLVPTLGAFAVPVLAAPLARAGTNPQSATPHPQSAAPNPQSGEPSWPPPEPARGAAVDDSFPSQHLALSKEMVGVSHGNLARVRELVQQH